MQKVMNFLMIVLGLIALGMWLGENADKRHHKCYNPEHQQQSNK